MLLDVKQNGRRVNDLRFKKGPIYIGRQMGSQIFLPQTGVSRQHAVIYTNNTGEWILEDLDSVNKTFVNHDAIHTCVLKEGDKIDIGDFTIEVKLAEDQTPEIKHPTVHLGDTIINDQPEIKAEMISPDAKSAPPITFPARRLKDIYIAAIAIQGSRTIEELHAQLITILLSQFSSHSTWIALRKDHDSRMNIEGGRHKDRQTVKRSELYVNSFIDQALEKHRNVLIPQLPRQIANNTLRSVMIAPIMSRNHCHGYLYANNSKEHEHYNNTDLEYLMVLATLTAAAIHRL